MIEAPLVFAFSAGLAAAFNPCGAAMLPAYVGYQLGLGEAHATLLKSTFDGLLMGLAATIGFTVVFGLVGLVVAAGGSILGKSLPFIGLGVGVIIAAVGVWLLVTGRRFAVTSASRVDLGHGKGLRHVFLFGIAYAIASLSCALPLFLVAVGIVVGQSLSTGSIAGTVVSSISYGLGMGVVIVSVTLGVVFFKEAVSLWIRKLMLWVDPVGKLAMIAAGAYLIHYWTMGKGSELLVVRVEELF